MIKLAPISRLTIGCLLLLGTVWPPAGPGPASAGPAIRSAPLTGLQGFELVAPGTGWVLLDQRLYWSSDGGAWAEITPAVSGAHVAAVVFSDARHGWLVTVSPGATEASAPEYRLFRTVDGGGTWASQALNLFAADDQAAMAGAVYLDFVDADAGWLVVRQATSSAFNLGTLFRTTDGGDNWQRLALPAAGPLHFTSAQAGILDAGPPDGTRYATTDGGETWAPAADPAAEPDPDSPTEVSRADGDEAWGRLAKGTCEADSGACALDVQLVQTPDGGQTWNPVPLPNGQTTLTRTFAAPAGAAAASAAENQVGLALNYSGHAFDSCPGPTLPADFAARMQTWFTSSPYKVWNLYLGGTSVASCGTLTPSLLQQLAQQGWLFIPTWVGPQAPCSGFSRKMSADPGTAYQQGVIEAFLAMDRAEVLRLVVPGQQRTALYYDLEAYSAGASTACREAVKAFINGWTATLRSKGHLSGVYGSPCGSFMNDLAGLANTPDLAWLASWRQPYFYDEFASVWNVSCVSNTLWSQNQRLRQYTGGHNENWGGVTFNIDSDVTAGVVTTVLGDCVPGAGQAALFVHANHGGQCVIRGLGDYSNPAALGLPNDALSSVRLGANVKLRLCEHDNYGGTCQDFINSDASLAGDPVGDNNVSSARVLAFTPPPPQRYWFPLQRVSAAVTAALPNGGFESGPETWHTTSARGMNVIVHSSVLNSAAVTPHGGNWAVWLGGTHTETVTLEQTISIPVDAPILSYWQWIKSTETGCYYDVASIWVNGGVVDSYGLCTANAGSGWVKQGLSLNAYAGQTVTLRFQLTTDTNLTSSLFLDDISLRSWP